MAMIGQDDKEFERQEEAVKQAKTLTAAMMANTRELAKIMAELDPDKDFAERWLGAKWAMIETIEAITDHTWLDPENGSIGAQAHKDAQVLEAR